MNVQNVRVAYIRPLGYHNVKEWINVTEAFYLLMEKDIQKNFLKNVMVMF